MCVFVLAGLVVTFALYPPPFATGLVHVLHFHRGSDLGCF